MMGCTATVRRGTEYERFVYEKFQKLFANSKVTLNDKISGKQSGLAREIDISIRISIDGKEVLYIIQCKDRGKRPADMVILGEFSSVIRDVRAAKGFLICTSGFAKSNYRYARSLGIELLTVEDIRSDRWRTDVQLPLIYIKKTLNYALEATVIVNSELAGRRDVGPGNPPIVTIDELITFDNGVTSVTIKKHAQEQLKGAEAFLGDSVNLDLHRPNLQIRIVGIWLECQSLHVNLTTSKKYYLKYLTPTEYSQVRDHRRDERIPLRVAVGGPFQLDDSFVEIQENNFPVTPVVSLTLEEWTDLERAQGKMPTPRETTNAQQIKVAFSFDANLPLPSFLSAPNTVRPTSRGRTSRRRTPPT